MVNNDDIEILFKTHYAQMFRVASMLLHDVDMARDMVHDVFSAIIDSPPSFDINGGYLVNSVRNRCLNYIRNVENREKLNKSYLLEMDLYTYIECDNADRIDELMRFIDTALPEQCHRVVSLYYSEGKRSFEIASELNISVSAVHKNLNRAVKLIRKKLNGNG